MAPIMFYLNLSCDLIFIAGCAQAFLIGNGECNDETNNPQCGYDGGDCCIYFWNIDHCTHCFCYHTFTCMIGAHPMVGDGFCDDETNNEWCNFDGGDCCGSCINKDRCSTNCHCIGNVASNGILDALIGDGFCNDETNNQECKFDGRECC